jgi:glycerol-3-phosphate acyltransferase PlsX
MSSTVRIALDAMGGDHGPSVVIPGAALSLDRHPDAEFLLFGDEQQLTPLLAAHPKLQAKSRVVHTTVAISMSDKPSQALRYGRWKSSMWLAIDAVKKHEADVVVSAGNTGALMAMSRFNLKMLEGIERPAIAGLWPTLRGESIVLDIGASIGADAHHLVNLAEMGAAMARVLFDIEKPTVGLLNVGVEEVKGLEEVKEAGAILRDRTSPELEYIGFVEGDDIGKGTSDVIVTEGFAGNIALKTAEGTARQLMSYLRSSIERTWQAKLGYLLARSAFRAVRDKMDPARSNGGVFLGLNGVVIKSHGGADAGGFASAVDIGYDMVRYDLLDKIHSSMARDRDAMMNAQVAGAAS